MTVSVSPATRMELDKLHRLLSLDDKSWDALKELPATPLRALREDLEQQYFDMHRDGFQKLARRVRLLSVRQLTKLATRVGPVVAARLVGELDGYIGGRVARRLPVGFLKEVAEQADPVKIRSLIYSLPAELIRDVALAMVAEKDYIVLGRLADSLSAPAIREVVNHVDDDAALLTIAFYMEQDDQLANIIRMIDNHRVASIVRSGTENPMLWPVAIAVIDRLEGELKSRLANIMVGESDATLDELVSVADQQQLWPPVLRALVAVNPRHYRKVVNLPALRDEQILANLVQAAHQHDLLIETLPLVKAMHRDYQRVIAHTVLRQGDEVAEDTLEAAHAADQWGLVLDLAQFLEGPERDALAVLPITHNALMIEALMYSAARVGKMGLLLDFARRFHADGLRTVVEISLRDGGELLEAFLAAARDTPEGWQALAWAVGQVQAHDTLQQVATVYARQPAEDQQAFREAAEQQNLWTHLGPVLAAS